MFQNEHEIDIFGHTKAEMIHQQTHTKRNVKRSLSGKKRIIPDGNLDLDKGNLFK